jgi:hypothetical protein
VILKNFEINKKKGGAQMKKILVFVCAFLFFCPNVLAFSGQNWAWKDCFGLSIKTSWEEAHLAVKKPFPSEFDFHGEDLSASGYFQIFPRFTIFCQDQAGQGELVFLVDFEGSKHEPEKIATGISQTFRRLQTQGFQDMFEILEKMGKQRLVIFLRQQDGMIGENFQIDNCFVEVFADFVNGRDESEVIIQSVLDLFESNLTCAESED